MKKFNDRISSHVVLIINSLEAGGSERVLTTLANAWARNGKKITVITLSDTSTDFFSLDSAVKRFAVGLPLKSEKWTSGLLSSIKRLFSIRRLLIEENAPVAVSFLPIINILTVLATIGLNVRTVLCERNDPERQPLGSLWKKLRILLYRFSDIVTANSRGAIDSLKKFVPANKLIFIPNPVIVPSSINPINKTAPIVLTIGSLTKQKAHDILIAAFANIARRIPDWRLAIVGDGHLQNKLREMSRKLEISDRIDWYGRVADPYPFYASADIFVLPSLFEGMPNALLEAMSCGLPVVVTDASPGPLEYVEHEVSGLVVPVNDIGALSAAIQRLIIDKDLRARLGREAPSRLADCEISKVLEKWENVFSFVQQKGQKGSNLYLDKY